MLERDLISVLAVLNQRGVIHHIIRIGGTNIERFNFLWRKRRWQLETTFNSHTYWAMPIVTVERQKQWSRNIMLYDTCRYTRRFEHLRERFFSMEESAKERIGGSAFISCTTATWRTIGHLRPTLVTSFDRCDSWKMHWMVSRYSPFDSKMSTTRRLLAGSRLNVLLLNLIYNYLECYWRFWNSLWLLTDAFSTTTVHFAATN